MNGIDPAQTLKQTCYHRAACERAGIRLCPRSCMAYMCLTTKGSSTAGTGTEDPVVMYR